MPARRRNDATDARWPAFKKWRRPGGGAIWHEGARGRGTTRFENARGGGATRCAEAWRRATNGHKHFKTHPLHRNRIHHRRRRCRRRRSGRPAPPGRPNASRPDRRRGRHFQNWRRARGARGGVPDPRVDAPRISEAVFFLECASLARLSNAR